MFQFLLCLLFFLPVKFLEAKQVTAQAVELAALPASYHMDMTYSQAGVGYFRFQASINKVAYECVFFDTPWEPSCYDSVGDLYCFTFQRTCGMLPEVNDPASLESISRQEFFMDQKSVQRLDGEGSPCPIDVEALAPWMQSRRVAFYTGAGISAASGVPMMDGLNALFGIQDPKRAVEEIGRRVSTPEDLERAIRTFLHQCLFSEPTSAHWCLARLCTDLAIPLYTENVDILHEYTKLIPQRINPLMVDDEGLSDLDVMICIGLSHDDKGFLHRFKECRPDGLIVAFDLECPEYLGEADLLIQGDLQQTLPELERKVRQNLAL